MKYGINAPKTIVEIKTKDKVVDNKISLFNCLSDTILIDKPNAIAPLIVPEQLEIPFSMKLSNLSSTRFSFNISENF